MKKTITTLLVLLLSANLFAELKEYKTVSGISGTLNSEGSATLNNLMGLWSEAFKRKYPNVTVQIVGKGSSTAPPALIEGKSQLGPMSREMKSKEEDDFEKKFGSGGGLTIRLILKDFGYSIMSEFWSDSHRTSH